MRAVSSGAAAVLIGVALAAPAAVDEIPPAALSAGSFTVALTDQSAYSAPAPGLTYRQHEMFLRGRQHFNQKWVVAPSLGGDWGLGPTFITDRCVSTSNRRIESILEPLDRVLHNEFWSARTGGDQYCFNAMEIVFFQFVRTIH